MTENINTIPTVAFLIFRIHIPPHFIIQWHFSSKAYFDFKLAVCPWTKEFFIHSDEKETNRDQHGHCGRN